MDTSHFNSNTSASGVSTAPVAREELRNATDPMQRMWDALETAGCQPHGELHQFRSRCPAHEGGNAEALKVTEATDRRVLLNCKVRGCDWRAIVTALGLDGRALFPAGHRHAENQRPRPVKSLSPGAAFLDSLTGAGYRWKAHVMGTECPYCGSHNTYLVVHDGGALDVDCPNECHYEDVRRAVETRAAIAEKGLDLS